MTFIPPLGSSLNNITPHIHIFPQTPTGSTQSSAKCGCGNVVPLDIQKSSGTFLRWIQGVMGNFMSAQLVYGAWLCGPTLV